MLAKSLSRPMTWMGIVGLGVLMDQPAVAQEKDDLVVEDTLEEVIVTGTRITRRDYTSFSPLVTISKEDLDFSGQPTLEEYLNQMPQLLPSTGRGKNNGSDGTAELNLRALGPSRTLVMLNGRRIAPSGTGSAIDVNNIPSTLIERVEIITGGASTVYGSDAIAGVVNFITRNDFEGLSIEGSYNVTAKGDADIWDANIVYGHEFGNGAHITAYAGRYERQELFAGERKFERVPLQEDWETGMVAVTGSYSGPGGTILDPTVDLGDGPVNITWDPDGTFHGFVIPDDLYNYQPVNYLQTPLTRDTVAVYGDWPLSSNVAVYYELSWAKNQSEIALAESPFQGFVEVNIDNPVLAPETRALFSRPEFRVETEPGSGIFVPGIGGLYLGRRLSELGPRRANHDRTYQRYLAGVRGIFGDSWRWDAWVTWTDANEELQLLNDGSRSRFQQGLLVDPTTGQCFDPSNGCVPIDPFGAGRMSPEAAAFLRVPYDIVNTTKRKQTLASLVLSGAPWDIWSGPVDLAFGAEWRRDEARYLADEVLFTGDTIGYRGDASINGTETVFELNAELVMSLFKATDSGRKLDLEAGVRWSDYDNAGSVTTWKAGLNWQATETLGLRTMYQHAVRAPNNEELFTEQSPEFGSFVGDNIYNDPCSASSEPIVNGVVEKCVLQGLPASQVGVFEAQTYYPTEYLYGGNPNLEPEASDTFTMGAVWNPEVLPDLVLSIDYWNLEITDTIGGVSPDNVCFDPLNTGNLFCDDIERDATGNVSRVTALIRNRGFTSTDGVDLQATYRLDLPAGVALFDDFAQLSVNATLSHVFSLEDQANAVTETFECAGYFGWPCNLILSASSFPKNRMLTTFNYISGAITGHLSWRWIGGMDNAAPKAWDNVPIANPMLAVPSVPAANYFDLGISYDFGNRVLVRFGINNLFDKGPAQMAGAACCFNSDTLLYDPYGRAYYLSMRFQATGH